MEPFIPKRMISTKVRRGGKWVVVSNFHKDCVELSMYTKNLKNQSYPETNKEWQIILVKKILILLIYLFFIIIKGKTIILVL